MMATIQEPAVQRRRLRMELKRARASADLTQKEVATALDWSPSKLIRIENGSVGITPTDLRALLSQYGITDADEVERLVGMARASRKPGWTAFSDVLSREYMLYLDYEAACSVFHEFSPAVVPGLLQTEEYAREIFKLYYPGEAQIDRRYEFRQERQELLERDDVPEMYFLLDEAAIARGVGGPGVMRRQLERLKELGRREKVTIQVLPFSLGAHAGLMGPMIILQFSDPADDDIVYIEDARGDTTIREDPEITGPYLARFLDLQDLATKPEDLDAVLDAAIDRLPASASLGGRNSGLRRAAPTT
jgi:transcriptional regulator with XRE-family HTH domain